MVLVVVLLVVLVVLLVLVVLVVLVHHSSRDCDLVFALSMYVNGHTSTSGIAIILYFLLFSFVTANIKIYRL